MTPEERTEACLQYLRCCERYSLAREDGDIARMRQWEKLRDQYRLALRRADMYPEDGPQGDAAC